MHLHDFGLSLIAFISEFLGTISGFGSSTFFVPAALLIESFQLVLALTAILHCFGNLFRMFLFREHFNWKSIILLAVPALIFTGVGAALTTLVPSDWIFRTLGGILILLSVIFYIGKSKIPILPKWAAVLISAFSGFSTGLVGTGGAIRGVALAALQIPKNTFVITSATIDVFGDLLRAGIYIKNGFMDWDQWFYIPLLGFAAFVGSRIGKRLLDRINQAQFDKIVSIFVFLSGLMMLFKS